MAYRVEVTREAQAETHEAFVWRSENHTLEIAMDWYSGLMEAFNSLTEMPLRCGIAPENDYFEEEIRQLLIGKRQNTYRVLFTLKHQTVYILHVRHGSQQVLRPEQS